MSQEICPKEKQLTKVKHTLTYNTGHSTEKKMFMLDEMSQQDDPKFRSIASGSRSMMSPIGSRDYTLGNKESTGDK